VRQHGDIPADFFSSQPPDPVMQGDVLGPLPFMFEDEDGELVERRTPGMLVSQSCDFDQDQWVLFAPAFPYSDFAGSRNASSIRSNEITNLFYLPPLVDNEPLVIDFRLMQPFAKQRVQDKARTGELSRIRSFTDEGWYLLLAKLTLHFLRPQTEDERRGPSRPHLADRVRYVAWQIPAMGRYVMLGRS